jgi:hypothetical protein
MIYTILLKNLKTNITIILADGVCIGFRLLSFKNFISCTYIQAAVTCIIGQKETDITYIINYSNPSSDLMKTI